jgi:hypothetical protein
VIEAQIQELGGQVHEESVEEQAARLRRSMDFEAMKQGFLDSDAGVNGANNEYAALRGRLEALILSMKDSIPLTLEASGQVLQISGVRAQSITVRWTCLHRNTLKDSELEVALWDGRPNRSAGTVRLREPRKLSSLKFRFDLIGPDEVAWVSEASVATAYSTTSLASFVLRTYLDRVGDK